MRVTADVYVRKPPVRTKFDNNEIYFASIRQPSFWRTLRVIENSRIFILTGLYLFYDVQPHGRESFAVNKMKNGTFQCEIAVNVCVFVRSFERVLRCLTVNKSLMHMARVSECYTLRSRGTGALHKSQIPLR